MIFQFTHVMQLISSPKGVCVRICCHGNDGSLGIASSSPLTVLSFHRDALRRTEERHLIIKHSSLEVNGTST